MFYHPENCSWHIFAWENVKCIEGKEAKKIFDSIDKSNELTTSGSYWYDDMKINKIESKCKSKCFKIEILKFLCSW